ncbi:MAG TPA: carbonic anhydrase family protein [Mucilaginibacter sp.]|nr:carbonic anhydrase family protein [Mucilaginibacter sp.]
MKKLILIFFAIVLFSCNNGTNKSTDGGSNTPASGDVITAEKQQLLTPDSVITLLKSGNRRFSTFRPLIMNDSLRIRLTDTSQHPMAAVLSCLDSRVPVETVFNMGIGDLFVARVAGNIGNEDIWGSLEYATSVIHAKVIMVLGHENCGAIKSAIDIPDTARLGNITTLLAKIRPAVRATQTTGERNSRNKKFVHDVMLKNVEFTIKKMREDSPIISKLEKDNKIKIIGGIYDVANGKITFL